MTTLVAPPPVAARWRRMVQPAATVGALALATVALHVRDPHVQGSWGVCPLAAMGVYCPGCGGLRAVNDLTRGDVAAAASSNLALVVLMPFAIVGLALWARARWRGAPLAVSSAVVSRVAWSGFAVLVVFAVLRNLPGSWLAP